MAVGLARGFQGGCVVPRVRAHSASGRGETVAPRRVTARAGVGRSRPEERSALEAMTPQRPKRLAPETPPPQRLAPETPPPQRLAEIQRSRLLAGAVGAIDEFGYGQATVAQITARSRVSRRTFYELFENREECLAALIEDVVALVEGEIATADLDGLPWRERVRGGLWAILSFFDREPALARVCVVQALRGGPQVLERRERDPRAPGAACSTKAATREHEPATALR